MAEPLKNSFGPEVPERVAGMIAAVHDGFDSGRFLAECLDGYDGLELTPRARHIAAVLGRDLPADRAQAIRVVRDSLGPADEEHLGLGSFVYLPFVYFVAEHGLEHFEAAMDLQRELTRRFTAEFSIRAYLEHHPDATLARMREWASDDDPRVRRLVSEGTRPRLPWAPRLRSFQADPTPVLELLELLKDDPEEDVRRSVANNLNDIAKDHPDVVVDTAHRWWADGGETRRRLVRHALRTLVKQGHPGALAVLGHGADSPIEILAVTIDPPEADIGDRVRIEVTLHNPADAEAGALVDLRVHFVKANGSTSPKVFKGAELTIAPGGNGVVRKTISVGQQSTRTHHPGTHRVEILLNGTAYDGGAFLLR